MCRQSILRNMYEPRKPRTLTVDKIVNKLWKDCGKLSPKTSIKKSPNCNILDDFFTQSSESFGGSSSNSTNSSGYYIPQGTFNGMGTDNIIINEVSG